MGHSELNFMDKISEGFLRIEVSIYGAVKLRTLL